LYLYHRVTSPRSRCSLVASSLLRRAPRPTLFPYTTLFRSVTQTGAEDDDSGELVKITRKLIARQVDGLVIRRGMPISQEAQDFLDRKSTRLNSSHVSISYAVFCLKKKTGKTGDTVFV